MSSRLHCWAVIVACLLPAGWVAAADVDPVPVLQRGVDRLLPADGPALLGAVLRKTAGGEVVMAIRRDWLKAGDPERLKRLDDDLAVSSPRAWRQLVERIDAWSATLKPDDPLLVPLALERKRVLERLAAVAADGQVPATRFVVLAIPAKEVSSLTIQLPARKQVALVAWVEGLERVEARSAKDLSTELTGLGINPATAGAESLWRNLPVVEDDEPTWRVRRALKTIALSEPLHFQGTGSLLLAVDPKQPGGGLDQPVDPKVIGELMRQAIGGDLGKLLEKLGGRPRGARPGEADLDPLTSSARRAESAGRDVLRVTRFRQDVAGRRTTVTSKLLVRLERGEWVVAWQASETVAVRARPEARKRIERDPRIRRLLTLVKRLGLSGGDKAIETALEFGAATQEGQQRLDARYLRFRDRYGLQLDAPPLWWGRTIRTKDVATPSPRS